MQNIDIFPLQKQELFAVLKVVLSSVLGPVGIKRQKSAEGGVASALGKGSAGLCCGAAYALLLGP